MMVHVESENAVRHICKSVARRERQHIILSKLSCGSACRKTDTHYWSSVAKRENKNHFIL